MPTSRHTHVLSTVDLTARRSICDGCDPLRPCEESYDQASLWLVTAGALEVRDRTGLRVIDPTQAIVMPARHAFTVRHPAGPDICVGFRGPMIDAMAAEGPTIVPITPELAARIGAELAAWRAGDLDELALPEVIASLAPDDQRTSRQLASAVGHALRIGYAESTSLGELAATTGYSVFHTCRVFQRTTGFTIHGFRRELRLRHALSRLLDGDEPLAQVAAATGFTSQSHLTNMFRSRFGVTPGRVRTKEGLLQIASSGV